MSTMALLVNRVYTLKNVMFHFLSAILLAQGVQRNFVQLNARIRYCTTISHGEYFCVAENRKRCTHDSVPPTLFRRTYQGPSGNKN